ncbi:MAG TPA: cysteine synthase A [Proteiniclasticum sp.]|jgi:cysteine synthase A|uniref:cysteine synthase A n=1 Tax=Proteiniclasticum sp. TaxID=2053595 RepID=UPI000E861873|nr:cysteine synthase A [Proteiniclasticum sp.]HBW13866.1 cysteine synthase A [Proteiniclasticum sp.]
MIYQNAIELVGGTPLLKVNGFDAENRAEVYVKLEKMNPAGSTKDRAALGMLEEAEKKGILKEGSVIIEPTSGNTGIALAMLGKAKGYRVIIVMPESMSQERRALIKAYGAELVLTEAATGMKGAIKKAGEIKEEVGALGFIPQQFMNQANPNKHYQTTAKEIFEDLPDVDAFVVGVGTGGTISGFGQYAKEHGKNVKIVAVEPATSAVLSGENPGPHKIQGIGAGFVPDNYHGEFVHEILKVSTEDAFSTAKTFGQEEGVLIGISSGANLYGALEVARKLGKGKKVVTVAPDGGEKYISMGLFD